MAEFWNILERSSPYSHARVRCEGGVVQIDIEAEVGRAEATRIAQRILEAAGYDVLAVVQALAGLDAGREDNDG